MQIHLQRLEISNELLSERYQLSIKNLKDRQEFKDKIQTVIDKLKLKLHKHQLLHFQDIKETNSEISQMKEIMDSQSNLIRDNQLLEAKLSQIQKAARELSQLKGQFEQNITETNEQINQVIQSNNKLQNQIDQYKKIKQTKTAFQQLIEQNNKIKEKLQKGEKILLLKNRLQGIIAQFQKKNTVLSNLIQENQVSYQEKQKQYFQTSTLTFQIQELANEIEKQDLKLRKQRKKKKIQELVQQLVGVLQEFSESLMEFPSQVDNQTKIELIYLYYQQKSEKGKNWDLKYKMVKLNVQPRFSNLTYLNQLINQMHLQ